MATTEQMEAIAPIVGTHNVKPLVMADKGIPAFYHEGSRILEQYAAPLPDSECARLKTRDELDGDAQDSVVRYAAGCPEWIEFHRGWTPATSPTYWPTIRSSKRPCSIRPATGLRHQSDSVADTAMIINSGRRPQPAASLTPPQFTVRPTTACGRPSDAPLPNQHLDSAKPRRERPRLVANR